MQSPIVFQMRWKYRKILIKATENYEIQRFTFIFLHFHSCLQYCKAFISEFNNTRTKPSPVLSFPLKQKYTAIIFEHKLCCYEDQKENIQRRKRRHTKRMRRTRKRKSHPRLIPHSSLCVAFPLIWTLNIINYNLSENFFWSISCQNLNSQYAWK